MVFGAVLAAHVIVFALLALRSGPAIEDMEEQPLVPVARERNALDEQPGPVAAPAEQAQGESREDSSFALDFTAADGARLPESLDTTELASGVIVELPSGRVLWQRNADQAVPIASMTKMMTALLAFEDEARSDEVDFDTVIPVTDAAYRIGGSQVWLDPRESFSLRELLISVMVKSANDSSFLVGEFLADGDMAAFVQRMNRRATELGMTSTRFINAHGLPDGGRDSVASCSDLVLLARALIPFDEALEWASLPRYTFRADAAKPTELSNHNRLVMTSRGVDGLKTGYTRNAGFCVTATCEREGRRMVAVVTGFKSAKSRDAFVAGLLDWAYQQ